MTPERDDFFKRELAAFIVRHFPALNGYRTEVQPGTPASILASKLVDAGYRYVGGETCCQAREGVRRMREHLADLDPTHRVVSLINVTPLMMNAAISASDGRLDNGTALKVLYAALDKAPT